jgi:hypothetical protein
VAAPSEPLSYGGFAVVGSAGAGSVPDQFARMLPRRRDGRVFVHYDGWKSRWDEWLPMSSPRIAPANTLSAVGRGQGGGGGGYFGYVPRLPEDMLSVQAGTIIVRACHRRLVPVEHYFLVPTKPVLFSTPLLLFFVPGDTTYAKLYELVWDKVRRYAATPGFDEEKALFSNLADSPQQPPAPGVAPTSSSASAPSSPAGVAAVLDGEMAVTRVSPKGRGKKKPASTLPPFVLRRVNATGLVCSECSWNKLCSGCVIEFSDALVKLPNNATIAIDWNQAFVDAHLSSKEMDEVWDHETVLAHRKVLTRAVSFADCMAEFTRTERLTGDSRPYCSDCKQHQDADKTLGLWSTPPILVIHLKRLMHGRKLFTLVDCPLRGFDPSPYCVKRDQPNPHAIGRGMNGEVAVAADAAGATAGGDAKQNEPPLYDLFAVVNHFGSSGAGHYVTYALNRANNRWYCMDDSRVYEIDRSRVIGNSAYMLFYQRRGLTKDGYLDFLPPDVRERAGRDLGPEERRLLKEQDADGGEWCPMCSLM